MSASGPNGTQTASQPQTWSLRVSLPTEFPPDEVVPYVEPFLFGKCRKISSGWRGEVFELRARCSTSSSGFDEIDVVLRVTPRPNGCSYIRIHESGFVDRWARDDALTWLQCRLNTLNRVFTDASRLRKRTRQAIIVVHGIGEQLPGQTLRSFTDGVFPTTGPRGFLKPDYTSSLFELRMMRIAPDTNAGIPPTDVYELYWAHLIRDTTLGQVYGWLLRLLLAPNADIPAALRKHFWGARLLIVIVAVAVCWLLYSRTGQPAHPAAPTGALWTTAMVTGLLAVTPTVGWAVLRLLQNRFVLGFLGDAARYLEPRPDNVARRQAIRGAGVELLDALHNSGDYSRIIVFGHSLGSVIAYDILSLAWVRRSRRNAYKTIMTSRELMRVEDLPNPRGNSPAVPCDKEISSRQYAAWREYRRNGFEWLVSDFVTAGSPLASAPLILNLDKRTKFKELVVDRSFPTCPPQTETTRTPTPGRTRKQFTFTHAYPDPPPGQKTRARSVLVPHYAGLFGLIRWTNLYFPMRGIIGGDPIGGRLRPTLGPWIHDVAVPYSGGGFLGFAHNLYWRRHGDWTYVLRLREALALPFDRSLDDLVPHVLEPEDLWWLMRRQRFADSDLP
jgi:hypothetical protein